MNRYIKIQLLKNGVPISPRLYLYKTSLDVQLGEIVQATEHLQGVVVGFEVISNIENPNRIVDIVGQIEKGEVIK